MYMMLSVSSKLKKRNPENYRININKGKFTFLETGRDRGATVLSNSRTWQGRPFIALLILRGAFLPPDGRDREREGERSREGGGGNTRVRRVGAFLGR